MGFDPSPGPTFSFDPLTALATNIQFARLPQTHRRHSLFSFSAGRPHYQLPPLLTYQSTRSLLHLTWQHLYMQGINYLHSQECLYHSNLKPEDWLAAYGAIIVPDFTEQILGALLDSSVVSEFATEIVEPLANRHDTTHVFNYLHRTLSAQQVPWTIFVPRHRTVVDPTPPEDDLVRIIPRDEFPSTGGWIDNIAEKIDHLVSLLTQADDLPRSRQGWIHLSALKRYDGPAVPGNQDPHTNTILHNRPFVLSRGGSSIPLDDAALFNLVAFDNRRRKYRLTLGEYIGGPPETNSSSPCLLTYHAPCWIARLPQHIVGLRPLPPPRLLCPTFPLLVYILLS